MRHIPDDAEDLMARARRGALSAAEEARLNEALASSLEDRFLFEAGLGFDADSPIVPGDEARIERIARTVAKRRASLRGRAHRRAVWAAAAGILLVGAAFAASAFLSVQRQTAFPSSSASPPAPRSEARAARPDRVETPVRVVAVTSDANTARAGALHSAPALHATKVDRPTAGPKLALSAPMKPESSLTAGANDGTVSPSAIELFVDGNRARASADARRATAAYQELQRRFPHSSEARASLISLGMIYLEEDQPRLALEQFRAFRRSGSGATVSEACWGEAQALRQLGDTEGEARVLDELLRSFPDSAYVGAAKGRLMQVGTKP